MNIASMHIEVKLGLDKTAALELPAFEPEEIDIWLNNAIRRFVKTRYSGVNSKNQSFEETQKRTDDLRTLIDYLERTVVSASASEYPNGYRWDLPTDGGGDPIDYWFTLSEECNITVDTVETRVGITESTIDEYRQRIDDPFSEHKLHYGKAKPLRIFNNNSVELIGTDEYSVTGYHLTYLKVPETVNISTGTDCDLPEHTHDEVVKLAVNMMLENIGEPRFSTHSGEVATIE